jgi:hypothetical protein
VLLDGLQQNPGSCEILFELGRLYAESDQDTNRALNVWNAAAHNWHPVSGSEDEVAANNFIEEKITTQLGETEINLGHPQAAIEWFEKAKLVSRTPDSLQARIDDLRRIPPGTASQPTAPSR